MRARPAGRGRPRSARGTASPARTGLPARARRAASGSRNRPMPYLNVTEIEAALEGLATSYPTTAELVAMPNRTAEDRQSYALRIGATDGRPQDAVVVTGGLHAREWVPPDALV